MQGPTKNDLAARIEALNVLCNLRHGGEVVRNVLCKVREGLADIGDEAGQQELVKKPFSYSSFAS